MVCPPVGEESYTTRRRGNRNYYLWAAGEMTESPESGKEKFGTKVLLSKLGTTTAMRRKHIRSGRRAVAEPHNRNPTTTATGVIYGGS